MCSGPATQQQHDEAVGSIWRSAPHWSDAASHASLADQGSRQPHRHRVRWSLRLRCPIRGLVGVRVLVAAVILLPLALAGCGRSSYSRHGHVTGVLWVPQGGGNPGQIESPGHVQLKGPSSYSVQFGSKGKFGGNNGQFGLMVVAGSYQLTMKTNHDTYPYCYIRRLMTAAPGGGRKRFASTTSCRIRSTSRLTVIPACRSSV